MITAVLGVDKETGAGRGNGRRISPSFSEVRDGALRPNRSVPILAVPPTGCVTSGRLLNFSVPRFPICKIRVTIVPIAACCCVTKGVNTGTARVKSSMNESCY